MKISKRLARKTVINSRLNTISSALLIPLPQSGTTAHRLHACLILLIPDSLAFRVWKCRLGRLTLPPSIFRPLPLPIMVSDMISVLQSTSESLESKTYNFSDLYMFTYPTFHVIMCMFDLTSLLNPGLVQFCQHNGSLQSGKCTDIRVLE